MSVKDDVKKDDVKWLMQDHYIRYASYVILDRAIPNLVDGLKPVQRRILYTLFKIDDGKLHKVANVVGQTMALHPHGDAPIAEALCNLANKGFLLDRQGNFGNIYTGDPAAAARYIETRISQLAKETMFNEEITPLVPSYDGRQMEPVWLPAKIPLLLMQGAEGIAVGMSTKILPHNFVELLEAEIAYLENRPFEILPDFLTGGTMDATQYYKGKGKVKVRAKIEAKDAKTIVITEICPGTSTESLTRSIDEAAKKNKIKIDSIHDYTAEKVEIEIKLPRGQYSEELITALYAYTECEVTISPQVVVIKDDHPWETDVEELLKYHANSLRSYLQKELQLELFHHSNKVFAKRLEEIFIEERLYKLIEEVNSIEEGYQALKQGFEPFLPLLEKAPLEEDLDRLLAIPIRRISLFDRQKNVREIEDLKKEIRRIEKDLKDITKVTVLYLKKLIDKYGNLFPRRTQISSLVDVDMRAFETRQLEIGFDPESGFLGSRVKARASFYCTNYDKILLMYKDGSYRVIPPPEKLFIEGQIAYVGVADKKTPITAVYQDLKSGQLFAKKFIVTQFIQDKNYHFLDDDQVLEILTTQEDKDLLLELKDAKKKEVISLPLSSLPVKGVTSKGICISKRPVRKISLAPSK